MHPRRFNELLKRRVSPYLFLATGPRVARLKKYHPNALMIYERGMDGTPHFVWALTQEDNYSPREPLESDLARLQSMDMDNVARGREGWVQDVSDAEEARQDLEMEAAAQERSEMFDNVVAPRARHMMHQGRVYGSAHAKG